LFSTVILSAQESTKNNYTGFWTDDSSWTDGTSPGTTLSVSVDIYGYIQSFEDITFNNFTVLNVYDTLEVFGNLSMINKAELNIMAGAIVIVRGDYTSGNKVQAENGGYLIVTGNFTMDGADQNGSFDNNGVVYILDPTPDIKEGDGYTSLYCDSPETSDTCGYGIEEDLINDPNIGDFFFGGGIQADGPTSFCTGGSVTLSVNPNGDSYQWYKDGAIIGGATSDNYTVTQAGDYTVDVVKNPTTHTLGPQTVTVASAIQPVLSNNSISICDGDPAPTFTVTNGTPANIYWYDDAGLTNQIANGSTYTPTVVNVTPGNASDTYTFYIIEKPLPSCQSATTQATYIIYKIAETGSVYSVPN